MLWFHINQFVTGQIPALRALTRFLFFCQHPFCPQNKAISRNLAATAKQHQCPRAAGTHAGCVAVWPPRWPRWLPLRCSPTGRAVRDVPLLPEYTTGTAPLLCMKPPLCSGSPVCSSAVVFLSPFKARLIAFKNGVPNQEDLHSCLAHWGFSSFPSIQRGFAIVAATSLGKTEEKKLKSLSKWETLILRFCPACAQFVSEPAAFSSRENQALTLQGKMNENRNDNQMHERKKRQLWNIHNQHNFD